MQRPRPFRVRPSGAIVIACCLLALLALSGPSMAANPAQVASGPTAELGVTPAQKVGGFGPGDVYREFLYSQFETAVCNNQTTNAEAVEFPFCNDDGNPNNLIERTLNVDPAGMTRAELVMEHWGGHVATRPQLYRINSTSDSDWTPMPAWGGLPGAEECYLRINLGKSIVPLTAQQLVAGANTFQFRAGTQDPANCTGPNKNLYNYGWGLYFVYSFGVRTYLDPASTAHPTAVLSSPGGSTVGEEPTFTVDISGSPVPVRRIELIGNFLDYDWDGNGVYKEWQYRLKKPISNDPANNNAWWLQGNIGSATVVPGQTSYNFKWNSRYVPDQSEPVQLMARLIGDNGVIANTPVLKVNFERQGVSIKMYTGSVIENFAVRDNNVPKFAPITITEADGFELRRSQGDVNEVRLALSTWGGKPETKEPVQSADGSQQYTIRTDLALRDPSGGSNHLLIARNVICNTNPDGNCIGDTRFRPLDQFGVNGGYDLDLVPVPGDVVSALRYGANNFQIYSNRKTHGIEINWPGPAFMVRYKGTFAQSRTYTVPEEAATPVQLAGSTSRLSGGNPAQLFFRVKTQPQHGTLTGAPDSSGNGVSYTSAVNYNGPDSFTFEVSTSPSFASDTWEGTINLDVAPVNDAPNLTLGSGTSVKLGEAFNRIGTFTDPEQDSWTGTVNYGDGSPTENLTVTAERTFTLSHLYGQLGAYDVTVTINDGKGGSDTATLKVTVATDPVLASDDSSTTTAGQPVTISVLSNDTDGAGGLTVTISEAPASGAAVVNGDRTITYTPNAGFVGTDSFEYTLRDSAGTASSARVTVSVTAAGEGPRVLLYLPITRK